MSRAWYLVALVPLAFGFIIAGISLSRMLEQIETMHRIVVPGERTFELAPGEYIIYGESRSIVDGVAYANERFSVTCGVTGPDGAAIPLETYGGKVRYSMGAYSGGAIFSFDMKTAGAAKVACKTDDTEKLVIAIGEGLGAQIVVAVVGALFGLFSAIGVFVVVLLKRRKYKRTLQARGNDS